MNLGYDVAAALPELRAQAESIMTSRVVVSRETGRVRDPETGSYIPTWTVIYQGKARLRMPSTQAREVDQAGQRIVESAPTLSLPIGDSSASLVALDDVAVLVEHAADPLIVGTRMRVVEGNDQTWSTARRFSVEILTPA